MPSATNLRPRLTREESVGLIVAAAAHAGLIAWLALHPPGKPVTPPPERMTVTLSDASAPLPTSPQPRAQPAAAPRSEPREAMAPAEPDALAPAEPPTPPPTPAPPPAARRASEPVAGPPPEPAAKPATTPSARPSPARAAKPAAKPSPRSSSAPAAKSRAAKPPATKSSREAAKAPARAAPRPKASATAKGAGAGEGEGERGRGRRQADAGVSRIGSDFLKGVESEQADGRAATPAAAAGPQVAASLSQAIARQLKPHWTAPQGADAEKLVTVLAWELKADGSLAGRPRVVSQSGVTPANRAQKDRHAEQAIRAVQVAAPFRLPQQHYTSWRRVTAFRFDRKLDR